MPLYADSNYSYNPWMRDVLPQMQPDVEGIALLEQEEMVEAMLQGSPIPPPAGITPRLGYGTDEPTIYDVLGVGPAPLMQDTETRQDSGMQGSTRNALGS